ncbi:hypothetical protein BSNT_08403 [Bacillus subtilis subsp. natto BEST195]|nr:hypothetical protein BSNT_08403 [Bacillus subtilis subsp. natto BEST195]
MAAYADFPDKQLNSKAKTNKHTLHFFLITSQPPFSLK